MNLTIWIQLSYSSFFIIQTLVAYLESIDLILEAINILNGDILASNLLLHLLQPLVKLVQVLVCLPELLLDGLLEEKKVSGVKRNEAAGHATCRELN